MDDSDNAKEGVRQYYRQPLIPLVLVFAAGIAAGGQIYLPCFLSGPMIVLCLVWLLLTAARGRDAAFMPLVLFFLLGWLAITGFSFPRFSANHVVHFTGDKWWTITGRIVSDPARGPGNRHFFLKVRRIADAKTDIAAAGRLRVKIYGAGRTFSMGDVIAFRSRIRAITNFKNPGGFDYRRYLAFQKVFGMAYAPAERVSVLKEETRCSPAALIADARRFLAGRIEKAVFGTSRGILQALIIGRKDNLEPGVREVFNRVGAGHLLAISGLHVGIVAAVCFFVLARLLGFVPFLTWRGWVRKTAGPSAIAAVAGYGLIAGMSPSTQRAIIMVTVFLLAFLAERQPVLINSLALAALVILAVHPPLLFSVSFQLSFAAVFFILFGMNGLKMATNRLQNRLARWAVNFLLVSALAVFGTAPLTMHYFNQFSATGLMANFIMVPLVGFLGVPLGLLGALLSVFSADLSLLSFQAAAFVIDAALAFARQISALPWSGIRTVTPNLLEICGYYALAGPVLIFLNSGLLRHFGGEDRPAPGGDLGKRAAAGIALAALLVLSVDAGYWIKRRFLHDDLRVTMLDVGQGNAALIEVPGGKCVLVDGGGFAGSTTFDVGQMVVAPFLWRQKIATVDTIILTHPDIDHLGGLAYIARHFHVKRVWFNHQAVETEAFQKFLDTLRKKEIANPDFEKLAGRKRQMNKVTFSILYPPADFLNKTNSQPWRNPNNNSLVIRVSLGDVSFLFPGDLMKKGEQELVRLAGGKLASTVLLAPHHGSRSSSTPAFLNRVRPVVVVVSAGYKNRYGYPNPGPLKRYRTLGAEVYQTGIDGAVIMKTRGKKLSVSTPLAENS